MTRIEQIAEELRAIVSDSHDRNCHGLCRAHHRRKTDGWRLIERPDGSRTLEPPGTGTAAVRRRRIAA